MIPGNTRRVLVAVSLCFTLLVSACSSIQPLPNFARAGDTISIAVRQTEPNTWFIKKEEATVTITDYAQASHPARLRHLFRVYSDPTSAYGIRSFRRIGWPDSTPLEAFSSPYQGQWVAIVDLVDPASGTVLPLAAGPAELVFSSQATGDITSRMEIIPGTGASNPLHGSYFLVNYAPIETLEPMPHVQVSLSGTPPDVLGGGSFTLRYTNADFGAAHTAPWVVTTSPDPNVQLVSRKQDAGDGSSIINVTVMNPHGFSLNNNNVTVLNEQMSLPRDLRFVIAWDKSLSGVTDANWQDSLQLVNWEFFDLDGNPVTGMAPDIRRVR